MRAMAPVMKGLVRLTADFAEAYGAAKKEKGWIDFSDLEHFCLQILLSPQSEPDHPVPSAAAEELRRTYKEVLIDEYQDTNGVQELITTLISRGDNRFMVGDIKQSIYRFRLADPTLFLENTDPSAEMATLCSAVSTWEKTSAAPRIFSTPSTRCLPGR